MADWYMSGPEEGDQIDQTVFVTDENTEITINEGTLEERKELGRKIAVLLTRAGATINGYS